MITFSETFYMFLVTSGVGLLLALTKDCYKSKCKEIDFCCMKIVRDTENEEKLDEISMKNKTESKDEKENSV